MYIYIYIYIYIEDGEQKGIHANIDGKDRDIMKEEYMEYMNSFNNGKLTPTGFVKKDGGLFEERYLSRGTGRPVRTYTLMHKDREVLRYYKNSGSNKVELINRGYLPFELRIEEDKIDVARCEDWVKRRVSNLSRTYMNRVYMIRRVGRSNEAIIMDSSAISITDNFWVKTSDVETDWYKLNKLRDIDENVINTALTGDIDPTVNIFTEKAKDTTSLFTIKGAFPKAVFKGTILKKDNNSEYEYLAYSLGNSLGISTAEAHYNEETDIVSCTIFTNSNITMTHIGDLLEVAGIDGNSEKFHTDLIKYFESLGHDIIVKGLQRLYILNYLLINTDLHYENFGILYDSETFQLLEVAPAFDFNNAFINYPTEIYYPDIIESLPKFLEANPDIIENLKNGDFFNILEETKYITNEEKDAVKARAEYMIKIVKR